MNPRKSILRSVLWIDLTIVAVIAVLFLVTGGLYARQLAKERYDLANTTLRKLNTDFQLEMQRIRSLFALCMNEPSIVYTLSNRLDYAFFLASSQEAAPSLSLICRALPYAESVFLYTRSTQTVIRDNGTLYGEEDFIQMVLNKSGAAGLTSIRDLSDGLYQYGDAQALYVKELYRHGYLAVQIDLSEFANLNKTAANNFMGYVLGPDGRCLVNSDALPLSRDAIAKILDGGTDFITVDETKYYFVSAEMNLYPYTGLILINNDLLMSPLHYMYTVMGITSAILAGSFLVLVLLNVKVYLPLKHFTAQFGNAGGNEVAVIQRQIQDLLLEIDALSQSDPSPGRIPIPRRISLYCLLSGGAQLEEGVLSALEAAYPYYMTLALTVQKQNGSADLPFTTLLERELTERFSLEFIRMDTFRFALVARPEDKADIVSCLRALLPYADPGVQVFAGIREYCPDIRALYGEYQLAWECLLSAPVLSDAPFSLCEDPQPANGAPLGMERQNKLFEYARNGAADSLIQALSQVFFPPADLTLGEFRSHYAEILGIFKKACAARGMAPSPLPDAHRAFNPAYMYQTLCSLCRQLFQPLGDQPGDMKAKMEAYISLHLGEALTLDTVAKAFSFSPVYLSSWFKKHMHTNFLSYISNMRMERAIQLLRQPHPAKINQIAAAVGIDNATTFIRQFKKYTGVTPSQYQKNCTEKSLGAGDAPKL